MDNRYINAWSKQVLEKQDQGDEELGKRVQETQKDKNLKIGIVAANNHYAGFGPATANTFRKLIGLPEVVWEEKKQATLSDF